MEHPELQGFAEREPTAGERLEYLHVALGYTDSADGAEVAAAFAESYRLRGPQASMGLYRTYITEVERTVQAISSGPDVNIGGYVAVAKVWLAAGEPARACEELNDIRYQMNQCLACKNSPVRPTAF